MTTLDVVMPKVSDRAITEDLMARLRRHYIKPGQPLPGGVFLPEVGWNGGSTLSRVDALYVGFTGTSGRTLIGHEVKASRADWLHELDQPGKADAWADQCHEWWLVTAPGIVHEGELPAGWGHMIPGKSKTRMDVVTKARRHANRTPSWAATRSIIARQDTLRYQAIINETTKARADMYTESNARVEALIASDRAHRPDTTALADRLHRIEKALGGKLVEDGDRRYFRPTDHTFTDLADVAALLRIHGDLTGAADSLVGRYAPNAEMRALRRAMDDLETAHAAAVASLPVRDTKVAAA